MELAFDLAEHTAGRCFSVHEGMLLPSCSVPKPAKHVRAPYCELFKPVNWSLLSILLSTLVACAFLLLINLAACGNCPPSFDSPAITMLQSATSYRAKVRCGLHARCDINSPFWNGVYVYW